MKLKATISKLEDVSEAFRELYTQIGDVFVLDVEDTDFKAKLGEFRNNNISLTNKLQGYEGDDSELSKLREQAAKFKDLDPEKAREALNKIQEMGDKQLFDEGKIEELFTQRIERMNEDHAGQVTALQKALEDATASGNNYRGRLSEVVIDSSLQKAISDVASVRAGAMQDIISRGRSVWSLNEEGQPIPKQNGEVMYGKDGKEIISMGEWAQGLVTEAPYLFEGSAGGGAGGSDDSSGSGKTGAVSASDQQSLNSNIEAIAKGEVQVAS